MYSSIYVKTVYQNILWTYVAMIILLTFTALHIADSVGSSTLGIQCQSFSDPEKNFIKFGHKSLDLSRLGQFFLLFGQLFPKLSRILGIKQLSKDVSKFFYDVIRSAIDQRRTNNVERADILQLLMNLEDKENKKDGKVKLKYLFIVNMYCFSNIFI